MQAERAAKEKNHAITNMLKIVQANARETLEGLHLGDLTALKDEKPEVYVKYQNFLLENVEKNSEILQHVSAGWKDDEAFMLKVCGRDGRYLKHASDRLKKDEAFIFGVFKQRDFSKK